jgi:hypothetical protein
MQQHSAPRHFTTGMAVLGIHSNNASHSGMPGDREAQIASRRAFVELKQTFMQAVLDLQDQGADWLRAQVRGAEEPVDLWLLRAPLFAAMAGPDPDMRRRRQMLRRSLDSVFHDTDPASAFTTL